VHHPAVWTGGIIAISIYRGINLARIIRNDRQPDYLLHITQRSSLWLMSYQAALCLIVLGCDHYKLVGNGWFYALLVVQLMTAIIVVMSTRRHLRTMRVPTISATYADKDLPTLSVLIPARNETDDLTKCLESLVTSTYPKLEILVLDDCSQNARTPEIIRSFAHDGVQFIAGSVPPDQWLAKNYAYQQLQDAANGELLLFCGVDARFSEGSLRAIVQTILTKHKSMLSIMPENAIPKLHTTQGLLVQPARYAWELALPRRLVHRPPVLSTCWIIEERALTDSGGFKAVSRSVSPERYLARSLSAHHDGYSFLQSDSQLGVSSSKALNEQRATAIRTRYPQLHRRLEFVVVVTLAEVFMLLGPLVLAIAAIINQSWGSAILAGLCYDIGLLNYSMWRYEFREVIWKDRNICVPVMRVIPKFPRLP
jgi:glycosyltransferase involved in cell wall biosynthesis